MASKDDFTNILQKLNFDTNFVPFITIDKLRQNFMLRDCEISIDEVKNLGDYIEIEYKGTNDNVDEVIAILYEILNEIEADVGPADYKGYAYNILNREKMEVKDETKEEIKVNFGVGGDICGGYQRIKIVEFESLDLESCKK